MLPRLKTEKSSPKAGEEKTSLHVREVFFITEESSFLGNEKRSAGGTRFLLWGEGRFGYNRRVKNV